MIRAIIQSTGAVVSSLIVAFLLVMVVEGISAVVHPFPPGFEGTQDEIVEHVAKYPGWILAVVIVVWGGIIFCSTWLATRIGTGRHPAHGIGIGLLLLLALLFNMYLLPYPIWFELLILVAFPIAGYYGIRLGRGSDPK